MTHGEEARSNGRYESQAGSRGKASESMWRMLRVAPWSKGLAWVKA